MHLKTEAILDCLIIGGGAAGLCALTYLTRFNRNAKVIDSGESRLLRIPLARNVPGYPEGVVGKDLHTRLFQQATSYGGECLKGEVNHIARTSNGFRVTTSAGSIDARTILLATGSKLIEPLIDGLEQGLARAIIRYCPICDGYETKSKSIAVLAAHISAIGEAQFLQAYTDNITYIPLTNEALLADAEKAKALEQAIKVKEKPPTRFRLNDKSITVFYDDGNSETYDVLYPCMGCHPRSRLAIATGVSVSESKGIITDAHQRTDVEGIYAAGDIMQGIDQIAAAFGQAAIAATAIHNDLRKILIPAEREDIILPEATEAGVALRA